MPDISDDTLIFEKHECVEGHCPICNSETLEYGLLEVSDNILLYPWKCGTCDAEGQEVGEIHFAGHDIDRNGIPVQVEEFYKYRIHECAERMEAVINHYESFSAKEAERAVKPKNQKTKEEPER